jgi:protein gp37
MARRLAGRCGYPEAPHHFDVTLHPDRIDVPLKRKKPTMFFVCSMSDLFHEDVPPSYIGTIVNIMRRSSRHTFQILTKRPRRMLKLSNWLTDREGWPDNVWLGVSVENQDAADERREDLERCPAAIKFVSYEPALGPIDWMGWEFVSQIISGGESGPGARPSHPDWHRATRDFCQANGIAYFFKAWGAWAPFGQRESMRPLNNVAKCWLDIRGQSSPTYSAMMHVPLALFRVGKKAAGHLLDGRGHHEFPADGAGTVDRE